MNLIKINQVKWDDYNAKKMFESEHEWVKSELDKVQIELMYHWTDDERASSTEEAWKQYARELRNYTTTNEHGKPQIREGETRPQRPTE